MRERFVTDPSTIAGKAIPADRSLFSEGIAWDDHKIAYMAKRCEGRAVLDIGCVEHDPDNYRSPYWLHKALKQKATSLTGLDLSREGVDFLRDRGFEIVCQDAQSFDLGRRFEVIVAGDVIEHLEDHAGFLRSVKRHLE
ncbi:MAG: class I SAM-dependent methyltransferase, partial [Qipengyuania sp.]